MRPRLGDTVMGTVGVRLETFEIKQLQELATERGAKPTQIARLAIRKFLKELESEKPLSAETLRGF